MNINANVKAQLVAAFIKLLDGPFTLPKVLAMVIVAHGNQEDKGRNSYVLHCLRVMFRLRTEREMIPGVSHDMCEDTFVKVSDLETLGYPNDDIKIIDALTKTEGYDHEVYISNIEKSPVASRIKLFDMEDNSRLDRLKNRTLTPKDIERMQRYINDMHRLRATAGII